MFKTRDDLRFAKHPVASFFSDVGCVENLDRDQTIDYIFSEIHCAHTTTPELVTNLYFVALKSGSLTTLRRCVNLSSESHFISPQLPQQARFSAKLFVSGGYLTQFVEHDATEVTRGGEIVVDCRRLELEVLGE